MLKYLPGLLLVQFTTVALVLLAPELNTWINWLRLLIPLLVVALAVSFWFSSLGKQAYKERISRLKTRFSQEREKLRVNAERAKTRIVKQSQQEIAKEARRTHSKANFKVGASFAGIAAIGAFMLITEFLMLGIMTLTTAGGALGGYLYRAKKGAIKSFPKIRAAKILTRKKSGKLIEQVPEKS